MLRQTSLRPMSITLDTTADGLHVSAVGACCSLGDAITACAAARAGIVRIQELKCMNFSDRAEFGREQPDGFPPVRGHLAVGIPEGFCGVARAVRLSEFALQDLLRQRQLIPNTLPRYGFHLILSDSFLGDHFADRFPDSTGEDDIAPSDTFRHETARLPSRILNRCDLPIPEANRQVFYSGNAGLVRAVHEAQQRIARGDFDACIVGGVESCAEPSPLLWAASLNQLKTNDNPCGYIPGEAAAFFLLEKSDAQGFGGQRCPSLSASAEANDERDLFTEHSPTGDGLAEAIACVLARHTNALASLRFVIADLNGTEFKALDWGYALLRLRQMLGADLAALPLWIPAMHFGETGAAVGPLAICWAAQAFARRYAPGDTALIWLACNSGRRAAIMISR